MARIVASPAVKASLEAQGLVPLVSTPDQFAAQIAKETATLAPVVKAANIRMDPN
jgi:tripartite-type tricarboxylate transporter receptor subunit TctC